MMNETRPGAQYDIAIVGGRVAGSATAIALARHDYRILLVERAEFPSDTLSTNFIWPDGMAALQRLGVLDRVLETGAPRLHHFQSWNEEDRLVAKLAEIDGIDFGLCPRRTYLDAILFETAGSYSNVDAFQQTRATALTREGDRVTGLELARGDERWTVSADLVIGADGRNSLVARQVGAEEHDVIPPGRYWYYGYFRNASPQDPPSFAISAAETDFIGTAPTNDGLQMVLYGSYNEDFEEFRKNYADNYLERVKAHPLGARTLANAELAEPVLGMSGIRGYYRTTHGPGWVLVGDAVHQKDPIAGRGMSEGLRGAEWLADALADGISDAALDLYATTMREKTWPKYQLVTIVARPDIYRTDAQGAILKERVISDEGLADYMRLWYDDHSTFDEYFAEAAD